MERYNNPEKKYGFSAAISYHSYGQFVLYPMSFSTNKLASDDEDYFKTMATTMTDLINNHAIDSPYTFMRSSELYQTAGDFMDYVYTKFKIPNFTIELRPNNPTTGFMLPKEEIGPTWEENKEAALYLLKLFTLKITEPFIPSTSDKDKKPVLVAAGPSQNPKEKINIKVNGVWRGYSSSDFSIKIGTKPARIISCTRLPEVNGEEITNGYELQVEPPPQPADGLYDLEVTLGDATDKVTNGIVYGETKNDIVLVVDRSGSMDGSRIADAKTAMKHFIDYMDNMDNIGVVSFSTTSKEEYVLSSLMETNKIQIKNIIDAINPSGNTSIGAGLLAARNQLNTYGSPGHSKAIIVLSDGEENTAPYVNDVLPEIIADGITVHTIGLADLKSLQTLQTISNATGGQLRYALNSNELAGLYTDLSAESKGLELLFSKESKVRQDGYDYQYVYIDSAVEMVDFSISWPGSELNLDLFNPRKQIITPNTALTNPSVSYTTSGGTMKYYRIMSPEPGLWVLRTFGKEVDPSGIEPYTAKVVVKSNLTSNLSLSGTYLSGDPLSIIVTVTDTKPISNAVIKATIQSPDKKTYTLDLYDDGFHGDGSANDGVYGNFFTETKVDGSYELSIDINGKTTKGDNFTRKKTRSFLIKQRPHVTVDVIAPANQTLQAGDTFIYNFIIKNNSSKQETFNLFYSQGEEEFWYDLYNSPKKVTIPGNSSTSIPIKVTVPNELPTSAFLFVKAVSITEPLNTDFDTVCTIVPPADLFLELFGPDLVQPNSTRDFVIKYGNNGPADTTNLVIAIELPMGVSYKKGNNRDSGIQKDNLVVWYLPDLSNKEQGEITFSLKFSDQLTPDTNLQLKGIIFSGLNEKGNAPGQADNNFANNNTTKEIGLFPSLYAINSLIISDRVKINTEYTFCGKEFVLGSHSNISGSVFVNGDGLLRSYSQINGNLFYSSRLSYQPAAMVNGKTQQLAMNSPSVIINKTIPYGITDLYIANDVTDLWKPGNYHTGTVKARGTVTLTAGTYNFKELIFEPNTKIILDTTNGMININVADHLSFGDNFTIVNNNSSGINFYTNVTDTVTIGTNSNFVGSLMAPNSKIVINSRTNIIGNLLGDSIQIEPDVTINSQ